MADLLQYLFSGLVSGSIYALIGVGFTGIYNATGIRVRDYPITLDKLLRQLPAVA